MTEDERNAHEEEEYEWQDRAEESELDGSGGDDKIEAQPKYTITESEINDEVRAYVVYDLQYDDIFTALKQFQKEMQFNRNLLFTGLLLVMFIFYVIQIIYYPNSAGIAYFLSGLILLVIGVIWYLPYRHRKSVAEAAESDDFLYNMYFYDTYAAVKSEEGICKIDFLDESVKVREFPDKYCVFFGKTTMFIIPKRCVDAGQREIIEKILKKNTGDRYKVLQSS